MARSFAGKAAEAAVSLAIVLLGIRILQLLRWEMSVRNLAVFVLWAAGSYGFLAWSASDERRGFGAEQGTDAPGEE